MVVPHTIAAKESLLRPLNVHIFHILSCTASQRCCILAMVKPSTFFSSKGGASSTRGIPLTRRGCGAPEKVLQRICPFNWAVHEILHADGDLTRSALQQMEFSRLHDVWNFFHPTFVLQDSPHGYVCVRSGECLGFVVSDEEVASFAHVENLARGGMRKTKK